MRIALVSAFYPYRGGIAQFGAMLYRELEKDHEVVTYTFKRQYPNFLFPGTSQFVTEEDNADPIPSERTVDSINPFSFKKTAKKIDQTSPDLVITQYWMTFFGPAFGNIHKSLKSGAKRLAILHNVVPHEKRFFDAPANRYFLKHNEGFVVMSDVVMNDLLTIKPDAKYLRIDHPTYNQFGTKISKEEALSTLKLPKEKKYLLFFGFIRKYKGLDLLLEALHRLDEEFHVIVAGEVYGSFDDYQELIDKYQLQDRVHTFTEYISDEEVKTYFSAADVCMLPYKSATQSGITAIAHNFEMPIIATDVGGLKESIEHKTTGLIVETPNAEEIANSIHAFFHDFNPESMRAAIRKRNAENTWENFSKRIIEFAETL
ncbi:MAG: glycosyltransferase [bacterium]|nr:glycosyltransferase [bacterium]